MICAIATSVIALLLLTSSSFAQTQTTGRIAGTVKDQNGAVIVGADVRVVDDTTQEERKVKTDDEGNYSASLLSPGEYQVIFSASGFATISLRARIFITEATALNVTLPVAAILVEPDIDFVAEPLIQTNGPQIGLALDARVLSHLPLLTRNFTQLLALAPGTSAYLVDGTVVGRNSQNISVNGARVTQNNFQINGIDANAGIGRGVGLANPAPESIQEFRVQTSLYDASFGRAGGGDVQIITKSGGNDFHGVAYDYFGNQRLNANNPFLKAVGAERPVLQRNIYGATLGGPIKRDRTFFFASYQGSREHNGASLLNSISSNVLIAQGLTDDRSELTLEAKFNVPTINPISLALLNAKSAAGEFLIPTPQAGGRYSGSAVSVFREEQFNANVDHKVSEKNWLSIKFFFVNAPQTLAISGAANVPGVPVEQVNNNRLISIQDVHSFNPKVTNEARAGYNFIRANAFTRQPLNDTDVGIKRSTAVAFPGLPSISIASESAGILLGTSAVQDLLSTLPSATFADTVSIARGHHFIRAGGELRYYQVNFDAPVLTRGAISFRSFRDFLLGQTFTSFIANGITERNLRANDYNFFFQDDWKISKSLTLNLGVRYELDLPPYDTRGRISAFDPTLYLPRPFVFAGNPIGPPIGGFVQAGNALAQYDLANVPNVGKRVVRSIDPNNLGPRLGFAYSPLQSERIVVRAGYGIFYSRSSFTDVNNSLFSPPFYFLNAALFRSLADPFPPLPAPDQFPLLVTGIPLFGLSFSRDNRTPYIQQYNAGTQLQVTNDMVLELAYVGTRGIRLFRQVAINQARLASVQQPIINAVTGEVITANSPANAELRAPFQGVALSNGLGGFVQDQTSGQSSYNSLQLSLVRRFARGFQLQAAYTFSKSIDNASGQGGGSGTDGRINSSAAGETSGVIGDQADNRANRGLSDFDRTHRLVISYLWDLPKPDMADHLAWRRLFFANWEISGIVTAMSGLPIDVIDSEGGSFYGLASVFGGARPDWAAGATRSSATKKIPRGYFFNPFAFARATVQAGQSIPSSRNAAIASATGTDFGNVGRNVLRGPRQVNIDLAIMKRFPFNEAKSVEFRVEFFNLLNHVNLANPISNLAALSSSGGSINSSTGEIINPGDFGRIISTSNNPRIIHLALKMSF
jgi:hypothetical protein